MADGKEDSESELSDEMKCTSAVVDSAQPSKAEHIMRVSYILELTAVR